MKQLNPIQDETPHNFKQTIWDFIIDMEEYNPQTSITRTVAETTLPWKTFSGTPNITPVSYETMVSLDDNEESCLCENSAWLADSDTDQLTVVPISMIGTHLKSCLKNHSQHDINEKVTVIHFRRHHETKMPTTTSAPHLLQSAPRNAHTNGKTKPDILNCSSPNKELQRTKKIDDFHESAPKYLVESIDLRQNTQVIKKGSPEDKLECGESLNGLSSLSHTSGTDECYLPATWTTRENGIDNVDDVNSNEKSLTTSLSDCHVEHDQDETMAEAEVLEAEANLPPPWKNHSESSDEGAQRSAVLFEIGDPSEDTSVRSLPWESHLHDEELMPRPSLPVRHLRLSIAEEVSMDEIDQSSMKCLSDHDADDCLPPPWRSVNVSERNVPIRSPSASHELDSLFPQASHNSLRLSEAESRHSEQFRGHHHVIDVVPRELEPSASCPALAAMVGTDPEAVDLVSRVEMWLLSTKLDQQDPIPDDLYYTESQCSDYDADTDLADCEDNSL